MTKFRHQNLSKSSLIPDRELHSPNGIRTGGTEQSETCLIRLTTVYLTYRCRQDGWAVTLYKLLSMLSLTATLYPDVLIPDIIYYSQEIMKRPG